jgi:hypothetical protein
MGTGSTLALLPAQDATGNFVKVAQRLPVRIEVMNYDPDSLRPMSRGVDARYLMAAGLFTMGLGNYWMSVMNLNISPWQVVWPRVVLIAGLSMLFAPLHDETSSRAERRPYCGGIGRFSLFSDARYHGSSEK